MLKDYIYTKKDLQDMQAWTLQRKIQVTQTRLYEWWIKHEGKIYISFSGGKDSTILADLAARVYKSLNGTRPEYDHTLTLVFVDTGLEYPEIRNFVHEFAQWLRDTYEIDVELVVIRPEMSFRQVITSYGYPVISKEVATRVQYARAGSEWAVLAMQGKGKDGTDNKFKQRFVKYRYLVEAPFDTSAYCCGVMKKHPVQKYERRTGRKAVVATMAAESQQREDSWRRHGCNSFDTGKSQPMSFWLEQDVLHCLVLSKVPYCTVYGEIIPEDPQIKLFPCGTGPEKLTTTGCARTGCMFCMFGIMFDKDPNRFQRMAQTHPKQYAYCINGGTYENGLLKPDNNGLGIGKVLDYIGVAY